MAKRDPKTTWTGARQTCWRRRRPNRRRPADSLCSDSYKLPMSLIFDMQGAAVRPAGGDADRAGGGLDGLLLTPLNSIRSIRCLICRGQPADKLAATPIEQAAALADSIRRLSEPDPMPDLQRTALSQTGSDADRAGGGAGGL